jgi:Kef-type K+ transport system membrane component KefB
MAAFFVAALLVGRHFQRIAAWGDRLGVSQGLLATVTVLAFVYAWAAEYVGGVAAITGSYVAGVLLTQTSFKKRIDAGVHPLTYSVLVPIFFISIGLRANGRDLGAHVAFTIAWCSSRLAPRRSAAARWRESVDSHRASRCASASG